MTRASHIVKLFLPWQNVLTSFPACIGFAPTIFSKKIEHYNRVRLLGHYGTVAFGYPLIRKGSHQSRFIFFANTQAL